VRHAAAIEYIKVKAIQIKCGGDKKCTFFPAYAIGYVKEELPEPCQKCGAKWETAEIQGGLEW
jgi:hypothetical protein